MKLKPFFTVMLFVGFVGCSPLASFRYRVFETTTDNMEKLAHRSRVTSEYSDYSQVEITAIELAELLLENPDEKGLSVDRMGTAGWPGPADGYTYIDVGFNAIAIGGITSFRRFFWSNQLRIDYGVLYSGPQFGTQQHRMRLFYDGDVCAGKPLVFFAPVSTEEGREHVFVIAFEVAPPPQRIFPSVSAALTFIPRRG